MFNHHQSEPVNPQLNAAVRTITHRLFPLGFDVASEAPDTLDKLNQQMASGRMTVWNGASDQTIYGDAETNYAFRAWHDWAHWRYQLPFNREGERAAAFVQIAHLARLYGDDTDVSDMAALVLADVVGQVDEFAATGDYPRNQRGFAEAVAPSLFPLADWIVQHVAGKSDKAAIKLSRSKLADDAMIDLAA